MTFVGAIFFVWAKIFLFRGVQNLNDGVADVAKNSYLCYAPVVAQSE